MKRLVDIVVASVAILLLSPIFILVAYKVRKNLGAPIFFYQERPGKDGKLFKMIKFRSMKDATDSEGNALPDEQRITQQRFSFRPALAAGSSPQDALRRYDPVFLEY